MLHNGSCLCQKILFEIQGEFEDFYLCHCEQCQKDTGSAHAANLFSTTATLKWIRGEGEAVVYNHNGSGHIKSFCPVCGSAIPNLQMDGNLLVIPAGSLDTDLTIKATAHIYYSERANWDNELELEKHYDTLPPE
jgi:hypothetical protein